MTLPDRPVEKVPPDAALPLAPQPDPPIAPSPGGPRMGDTVVPHPPARPPSESILRRRIRKFRRLKRGYYSFVAVVAAYALSFFLPVLANNIALVVKYHGAYYFPFVHYRSAGEFGQSAFGDPDYRALKQQLAATHQGDWVLMPPMPYGPNESLFDLPGSPP